MTGIQGKAQPMRVGQKFIDTDTVVTAAAAAAFRRTGFEAAARYVSRVASPVRGTLPTVVAQTLLGAGLAILPVQHPAPGGTLTTVEAQTLLGAGLAILPVQHPAPGGTLTTVVLGQHLGAGLAILPVQHPAPGGTLPTVVLGQHLGDAAVWQCADVGVPSGVTVWLDLEGLSDRATAASVAAFATAWFMRVEAAHYVPGIYIGANCDLDAHELAILPFEHYWHGGSRVAPEPAGIGAQVRQHIAGQSLSGVAYDWNEVFADTKGRTPTWWAPPPHDP